MNQTQDFTKGVIWKQLLFFFFPILIGSFFQQLYNTVDTIIVGQAVGTSALAAVGSTGNLTNLIVNFYVGLSTGASVVIAQYYGAQNNKKIHQAVHTSYILAIVSGILMMLFGLFFSYQCLDAIGTPHDILTDATLYMQLYFLCMIPGAIYNIGAGILRAVGDSKRPLYYLIVCSIVNVVFDFIFVVIFHQGIAGAAIATVIAQSVCAILVTIQLMRTNEVYKLTSSNFDSETKTTGKFAIVENALKEYYTEYLNTSNDLVSIYSKNLLANSLTASNISSDGPEFTKTKENINKIKETETSTLAKYDELISDEYISSKASELNLSEYYSNLFIDKINQNLKVKEDVNTLKEIVSEYDKWLDDINNVFAFLNTNKDNWKISGNNVMFTNVKLVSQYNSLISDLSKQESVLNIKLKSLKTN